MPADARFGFHPDDTTPIPRPSRYYGRRQDLVTLDRAQGRRNLEVQPSADTSIVPASPGLVPTQIDKSVLAIAEPKRTCVSHSPEPSVSKSATSSPYPSAAVIIGSCIKPAMKWPGGRIWKPTPWRLPRGFGSKHTQNLRRQTSNQMKTLQRPRPKIDDHQGGQIGKGLGKAPGHAERHCAPTMTKRTHSNRFSMTSLKQIEANRRNALKSTGPTTPEGKERSRRNALRHGLTAETVIAALENSEDYEAFEAAVISDYDAESAVERELVLRLASVLWRLRRATGIGTAIFESVTVEPGKVEHGHLRPTLVEAGDLSDRNQLHLVATRQSDAAAGNELGFGTKKDIADGFLRLAALPTFALDRLSRYEHLLWRQASQIVFTLESLRRRKRQPRRSTFPFTFRRREPDALSEEFR